MDATTTAKATAAKIAEDYAAENLASTVRSAAERLARASADLYRTAGRIEAKETASYLSEIATLQNQITSALNNTNMGTMTLMAAEAEKARYAA